VNAKVPIDGVRRLVTAMELNDAFQLCFVFGSAGEARDFVAAAVARVARSTAEPLDLRWFLPSEAGVFHEKGQAAGARAVWVVDSTEEENLDIDRRLRELNTTRDTMASHRRTTLIVLLRSGSFSSVARVAPDLWSARTLSISAEMEGDFEALGAWRNEGEVALEALLIERPIYRDRYSMGVYSFAYEIGSMSRDQPASLRKLLDTMSQASGWTGWRPWWVPSENTAPYAANDGALECWMASDEQMFPDPAHSDFWRASPEGRFFLLRGYDEDSTDEIDPGERTSMGLPVWRAGEALFHARQMAEDLGEGFTPLRFSASWSGLRGRTTTEWPGVFGDELGGLDTRRDSVSSSITTDADEIRDDLAAVVLRLLQPLYDAFLASTSEDYVRRNIDEMRRRPVRH